MDDTNDARALEILKHRCLDEMACHDYLNGPCLQLTAKHVSNLQTVLAAVRTEWACAACTFLNKGDSTKCEMCE